MKTIAVPIADPAAPAAAIEALLGLPGPILCRAAADAALEEAGYNRLQEGGWLWLGPRHPSDTSQEEVSVFPKGKAEIIVFAREGGDLHRRAMHAIQRVTLLG